MTNNPTSTTSAQATRQSVQLLGGGAQIQQAKKLRKGARFLQIVAKPGRFKRRKTKHKLTRVVFQVSRLMEFCTKRELVNQTAHSDYDWPLVVLKELMDNALDACEEAEVTPVIEVIVGPGFISITDNADGSRPRPSTPSSTTAFGCPAAKPMCRRPVARKAMRSRPS
jgi:hypothetical protein